MSNDSVTSLQILDDVGVGVENVQTGPRRDFGGEAAVFVHRAHRGDPDRVARVLVVLTEAWSHVHDAGSVLGRDEVAAEYPERVGCVGEELEQRRVVPADQIATHDRLDVLGVGKLALVRGQARFGEDERTPSSSITA